MIGRSLPAIELSKESSIQNLAQHRFRDALKAVPDNYIAFLGGEETFGYDVAHPYPALLEQELGETCVNLGQRNASVDIALNDPHVGHVCRSATLTVVGVTGAANMSNRLYKVHPRKNERFIKPSTGLRTLFPEVDFSEVCFAKDLLDRLQHTCPDRFASVRTELQAAWSARMRTLIERIGPNVILMWLASRLPPTEEDAGGQSLRLDHEPLFVTSSMLEQLRPLVRDIVIVSPGPSLNSKERLGMTAHRNAAAALLEPVQRLLSQTRKVTHSAESSSNIVSLGLIPSASEVSTVEAGQSLADTIRAVPKKVPDPRTGQLELVDAIKISSPEVRRHAVAVVPFSMIGMPDQIDGIAEMLADDVTEALCRSDQFWVKLLPELDINKLTASGQERLTQMEGISYLIGGKLRVIGGETRITIKILDLIEKRYVWVRSFDQPPIRSIRMLDEICDELLCAVSAAFSRVLDERFPAKL